MNISVNERDLDRKFIFKCSICNDNFETKGNLMLHKKKKHLEKVATCWNFTSKSCHYQDELCWFSHQEKDTNQEMKCNFCAENFKTKNDLQLHKKRMHISSVSLCANEICTYKEKCWFRHDKKIVL